jgi:hypothetical protein
MSTEALSLELKAAYKRRETLESRLRMLSKDNIETFDDRQDILKELGKLKSYIAIAENAIETLSKK